MNEKQKILKAKINPSVLLWAREIISLSQENVVKKVTSILPAAIKKDINVVLLDKWEKGSDSPSIQIAKILANIYGIKFISLYLPDIPKNIKPLKDFRGVNNNSFSRSFILLMREIQGKQEWLSDYLFSKGKPKLNFVGSVKYSDGLSVLVKALNNLILKKVKLKNKADTTLPILIDFFENLGIFISISNSYNGHYLSAVSVGEVRGFAISDKIAPFIFINSKDAKNGQLFTLIHEFCHILLGETGISDISREAKNPIEVLCNKATAEFLMPTNKFMEELNNIKSNEISDIVYILTQKFPVSEFAILIKLFNLNYITSEVFETMYNQCKSDFEEYAIQEKLNSVNAGKKKFSNPYLKKLKMNGKHLINVAWEAYSAGDVVLRSFSSILGVGNINKLDTYLEKWRKYL